MTPAEEINAWARAEKIIMPNTDANFASAWQVTKKSGISIRRYFGRSELIIIQPQPQKIAWVLWELSKAGAHGARYA